MSSTRAQEILYESEAALRLVDHELDLLRTHDDELVTRSRYDSAELPAVVEQASAQLLDLVTRVRETRVANSGAPTSEILDELEQRLVDVARFLAPGLEPDDASNANAPTRRNTP